jgi:hypothetical protein
MAEDTKEGAAHPFLVAEAGLGGDDVNGVSALLDH